MKTNEILFCPLRKDVTIPTKRDEDAGWDVYANFSQDFMVIMPHQTVGIPTGLATVFSKEYVAILKERGSTGTKGIGQRCGVIDSGYRDEWFIPLTNHNTKPMVIAKEGYSKMELYAAVKALGCKDGDYTIYPYNKAIAQFIMVEVPKFETRIITQEELESYESERGKGSKGSSGK